MISTWPARRARHPVGAWLAVGLCLVAHVAAAGSPTVGSNVNVISAAVTSDPAGQHITLTILGAEGRAAVDVDVLVVLDTKPVTGVPLDVLMQGVQPTQSIPWGRVALDGRQVDAGQVALLATQPAPIAAGGEALVTQKGGKLFVRLRVPDGLKADEERKLTVDIAVPGEFVEAAAQAVGYTWPAYSVAEFETAPADPTGITVLFRTAGVGADPTTQAARIKAMAADEALRTALTKHLNAELLGEGTASPIATATALWLLPQLDPEAYEALCVDAVDREKLPWTARFVGARAALKKASPLAAALLARHLSAQPGSGDEGIRMLASGVLKLSSPRNADLLLRIEKEKPKGPTVATFVRAGGAAFLRGAHRIPAAKAEGVLQALGKRAAADAVASLFRVVKGSQIQLTALDSRVGRPVVFAAARAMTSQRVPAVLADAVGMSTAPGRDFAKQLLLVGGPRALATVDAKLAELGFGATARSAGSDAGTALADRIERLQSVLLTPRAAELEAEAERLVVQDGDCLAPIEKARETIHPLIVVPAELEARCLAIRADILLNEGKLDEAAERLGRARLLAPDDVTVTRQYVGLSVARARGLVESGKLDEAEALFMAGGLKGPAVDSVRADIAQKRGEAALEAGDRDGARAYFEAAHNLDQSKHSADQALADPNATTDRALWALFIVLLMVGLAASGFRQLARRRAIRDFEMLADEKPARFSGPGGRRIQVGGHALLALGRFSHRLVAWAELEGGYVMPGRGKDAGLLLWHHSGDAFLMSSAGCDAFDEALAASRTALAESRVPFFNSSGDDEVAEAENEAMIERLTKRAGMRRVAFAVAIGLGLLAALGVGLLNPIPGLGIGLAIALVATSIADTLLPMSSI